MILMAIVVTEGYKQQYYWHEMNTFMRIVFVWGLGGGFLLWFWMLGAHFKGSATQHPIIWGFMLLFAHIMAAVLYFIFVYSRDVPNETIRS